jgi:PTH1 family peptidyl-tRNA hydrolase
MVVDHIAEEAGSAWTKSRDKAEVCELNTWDTQIVLVKPQTFMNLSGRAVGPILKRVNADPARMIVIHDDLDLPYGRVRIKVGGGDGGHKGVRSVSDSLRFRDFIRVRLGVGRPPPGISAEDFVLRPFGPEEENTLKDLVATAAEAVNMIVGHGVEGAQKQFHSNKLSVGAIADLG